MVIKPLISEPSQVLSARNTSFTLLLYLPIYQLILGGLLNSPGNQHQGYISTRTSSFFYPRMNIRFITKKKDACNLILINIFKPTRYIHQGTNFRTKPYDYCRSVKSIYSSPDFPTSCSMFAFCVLIVKVYSLSFLRSDNSKLTINFSSTCLKMLTPYHLHWLVVQSAFLI